MFSKHMPLKIRKSKEPKPNVRKRSTSNPNSQSPTLERITKQGERSTDTKSFADIDEALHIKNPELKPISRRASSATIPAGFSTGWKNGGKRPLVPEGLIGRTKVPTNLKGAETTLNELIQNHDSSSVHNDFTYVTPMTNVIKAMMKSVEKENISAEDYSKLIELNKIYFTKVFGLMESYMSWCEKTLGTVGTYCDKNSQTDDKDFFNNLKLQSTNILSSFENVSDATRKENREKILAKRKEMREKLFKVEETTQNGSASSAAKTEKQLLVEQKRKKLSQCRNGSVDDVAIDFSDSELEVEVCSNDLESASTSVSNISAGGSTVDGKSKVEEIFDKVVAKHPRPVSTVKSLLELRKENSKNLVSNFKQIHDVNENEKLVDVTGSVIIVAEERKKKK